MINYLAVLASAIVSIILGAFWYSPSVFGKIWMKLSQTSEKKVAGVRKRRVFGLYFTNFIASLVLSFVLAFLIQQLGITDLISGAGLGILVWFGFILTTHLGTFLWEDKPLSLYILNMAYQFIYLVLAGIIIVALQ